jgi:hypothetical protein
MVLIWLGSPESTLHRVLKSVTLFRIDNVHEVSSSEVQHVVAIAIAIYAVDKILVLAKRVLPNGRVYLNKLKRAVRLVKTAAKLI